MTQSLILIAGFLLLLACLPWAIKWVKQHRQSGSPNETSQLRFVSALAVGPHQRVVTVEAGPEGERVWLTLGVTSQTIACLHTSNVSAGRAAGPAALLDPLNQA